MEPDSLNFLTLITKLSVIRRSAKYPSRYCSPVITLILIHLCSNFGVPTIQKRCHQMIHLLLDDDYI